MGEDSVLIDKVLVETDIFGVDVENPIDELADGLEVVHVLEDQVGRIVVESEIGACKVGKETAPDSRGTCDVFATRPFVGGKEHRAVFDSDSNAVLFGKIDDGSPGLEHPGPVVFDTLGMVATDEGVDLMNTKTWCSSDHMLEMFAAALGLFFVGIKAVGVASQAADTHVVLSGEFLDRCDTSIIKIQDIDVSHSGVATVGFARRPAHEFDGLVTDRTCQFDDLFEVQFWDDRANETELHHGD